MIGIHTFWSIINKRHVGEIFFHDIDILYTLYSTLEWKNNVGPIHLYCDEEWSNFFESIGALDFYDNVNTEVFKNIPSVVNPAIYVFFPKMFVLQQLNPPFALVDYDIICDKNYQNTDYDLIYYHKEKTYYPLYVDPKLYYSDFDTLPISEFSFKTDAFNTGISIYNNADLIKQYTEITIPMMTNSKYQKWNNFDKHHGRCLTIEQHLLAEIVTKYQYKTKPIINETYFPGIWKYYQENVIDFHCENNLKPNKHKVDKHIHHIWLKKNIFKTKYDYYLKYIDKTLLEIQQKYPQHLENIIRIMKKAGNVKNQIPKVYFNS